jgi:hypothetical protein
MMMMMMNRTLRGLVRATRKEGIFQNSQRQIRMRNNINLSPILFKAQGMTTSAGKIDAMFLASRKQFLKRARLISITGVVVSVAFAASLWSDIRTSQLKGWVLRCMDTFELLDKLSDLELLKLLRENCSEMEMETSWMGISTIATSLQCMFQNEKNISTTKIRDHPVFASLLSSDIDMAAIFDEEETDSVPLNRLIFGVTLMYVLSQDKVKSSSVNLDESNAHEISWMTLVNLSGERDNNKDPSSFVVPLADVRSWIEAAACLGIVRGYEFLNRGGLYSSGPCSERLFETWIESSNISSSNGVVTRSQFFNLLSHVEYGMFWNRNQTTYRTIEFYKKRKREMEHKMSLMESKEVV